MTSSILRKLCHTRRCEYCDTSCRYYPYFFKCQLCDIFVCKSCKLSLNLNITIEFYENTFDIVRCQKHIHDPIKLDMSFFNRLSDIVRLGGYDYKHSKADKSYGGQKNNPVYSRASESYTDSDTSTSDIITYSFSTSESSDDDSDFSNERSYDDN